MAQLPPKIPDIVLPDHHHQHHPHEHNPHQWPEFKHEDDHESHNPSWVDEFMEFSAAKRGAHRRTVSDSSVAFIEAGGTMPSFFKAPETGNVSSDVIIPKGRNSNISHDQHDQFEKFDDEQFMSMFSNELGSCSNPSSTSDHNSTNEEQKKRERREERERAVADEVESSCKQQGVKNEQQGVGGEKGDASSVSVAGAGNNGASSSGGHQQVVADPKRVKRILANRQSAQRSRVRKLQYISELERSVTALQSEVSVLSPRVAFLDHQRMLLNLDNSALKSKLAALAQDKIFKDAHQEALKREIERLRQVYYQQNLKKNDGTITPSSTSPLPSPGVQPPRHDIKDNDSEQPTG